MFPWPSIAAAALAAAWLSVLGLTSGGFSVVVVAIVTALVVGIPMARTIQDAPQTDTLMSWSRGVRMVAAVSVMGGVLSVLPLSGPLRAMLAATVWIVASVVGPRPWSRIGLVVLVAVSGLGLLGVGHWTLLEPHWEFSGSWFAQAAVVGLLLASAGGAGWTGEPRRAHPSLGIGLGGLALVGMALLLARDWELGSNLAGVCALLLTSSGVLGATDGLEHRRLALPGAVLAGMLALVPASAALAAVSALLPLALGAFLSAIAWEHHGTGRLRPALLAALCLVVAWLAWPGLPASIAASVALALVPVVLVWTVGTATVRVRSAP